VSGGLFRDSISELVPYEPGKPVEEVQRELGLDRVVKLASNEGPFPPFPAALEAIERTARDLNRYPDGGVYALRAALAEHHGVRFEEIVVGGGADGVIDLLSQAALDPGDEIVCGWPSFPSYVIDAAKMGAVARTVPLRDHVYDLDGLLAAISPRTKLVYVCHPNNPTGTRTGATSCSASSTRFPSTCSSCSTRRTSSTSTTRAISTGSPRRSTPVAASSCSGRSRRSTGSRDCASATASPRPTS
jgi:Histidinol-phosphate/aromatic aminotransferase and cobyric acid decarboxylase